jgi:hypothetical protein
MEIVDRSADVRKIDASCRDKFKWEWLESLDTDGFYYSDYVRKLLAPGKAMCIICKSTITYGTSGKKAFLKHSKSMLHKVKQKIKNTNETLPSIFAATSSNKTGKHHRSK